MTGPAYGLVEATPPFVTRRLEALSAALALPLAARDAFLFDASPAFYRDCTESIVSLQKATRRIVLHLGLSCDSVIVSFVRAEGFAGRIERDGACWFVEIDERYRGDALTLGAILAHECCHILLSERRVRTLGNALDEVHVDLTSILAGLGPLTLNGVEDRFEQDLEGTRHAHRSVGYLRAGMLEHAYAVVVARLGIPIVRATSPLRSHLARQEVRIRWIGEWVRTRVVHSARLHYGPPQPMAIVDCPSGTCVERLRVPVGRLGTMRCPVCRSERRFDGRSLEAAVLVSPAQLAYCDVPRRKAPPAWRAHGRGVPRRQIAGIALILVAVLWVVVKIYGGDSRLADVGDACDYDAACRSASCMTVMEPFLEEPGPGRRVVRLAQGYCTRDCTQDDDCPVHMACGVVEVGGEHGYRGRPGDLRVLALRAEKRLACVRR